MKKKELKKINKDMEQKNKDLQKKMFVLLEEYSQLKQDCVALENRCRASEAACFETTVSNICMKREMLSMKNTKTKNLSIVNVSWNEDVTVVDWSDGTSTTVTRQKGEKYDRQSAIAYAISKKVLGKTSVEDVVNKFSEENKKDDRYVRVYKALKSKSYRNRINAQKEWESIPESKRQSIKARVANQNK